MKNAAKCDTECELQNSVNHQIFERNWRFRVALKARFSEYRFHLTSTAFVSLYWGANGFPKVGK